MAVKPLPSLIRRASAQRANQQLPVQEYQPQTEEEQSLLGRIGGGFLSGLGMAGNFLDVPGSMVRDLIVGQNPLDQLLTPFSFDNRATGREVLSKFGMRKNRETGIGGWVDDPGEGLRDVAGFGAEVLLDPLTYLTFGGAALGKAGQVAKRAGLMPTLNRLRKGGVHVGTLTENARRLADARTVGPRQAKQMLEIEDLLSASTNQPAAREAAETAARAMGTTLSDLQGQKLGKQFGLGLPFGDPLVTFNAPGGAMLSRAMDATGNAISKTWPARYLRGMFDPRVGDEYDRVAQEIAELRSDASRISKPEARMKGVQDAEDVLRLQQEFDQQYGGNLLPPDTAFHPHDIRMELPNVDQYVQDLQEYERWRGLREFRRRHPEWGLADRSGDYTTIPNYDTSWSDFFGPPTEANQFGEMQVGQFFDSLGNDIPDPQALWDILGDPNHPSLTRHYPRMRDYQDQAIEQLRQRGLQTPFNQGQVVRLQNGNEAYVTLPGSERSQVFYREPTTGRVLNRSVPNTQLEAVQGTADELAALSEQQRQAMSHSLSGDLLRAATEYGDEVDGTFRANAQEAFRKLAPDLYNDLPDDAPIFARINETAERLKANRDPLNREIEDLGGKTGWVSETIKHYPRYTDPKTIKEIEMGRALPTRHGSMRARTPETRNLPAHVRDEILENPAYRGENGAERILDDYGDYLDDNWGRDADAFDVDMFEGLDDAAPVGREAHAQALADWIQGRPHMRMTGDAINDHAKYMERATATRETIAATHDILYRYAAPDIEGVPLSDAFRRVGLDEERATRAFRNRYNLTPAQVRDLKVPEEFIKGATSVINYMQKGPKWQGKIADLIDKFNRWFKTYVTVPFPGFVARNFASGQHLNLATSIRDVRQIPDYIGSMKEAKSLMDRARKAVADGQDLAPADKEIFKELYGHEVVDPRQLFEGVETTGMLAQSGNPLEELIPPQITDFRGPQGHYQRAHDYVADYPIEFDLMDTTQSTKTTDDLGRPVSPSLDNLPLVSRMRRGARTWVEAGTAVNKQAEWFNRVPLYLFYKKQGYSPAQAAQEVIARHFNYGDVSQFERSVAKRVFPFWTFSKKIAPLIGKELMERPGGGLGQSIRAANNAAGGNERPLPQYVRETSAIPWGESDDGTMRYLTGFGLAHEDPLSFLGGGIRGAGVEAISRSNPLFKGPLEWFTGESFFQRGPMGGRDLADMDPVVGRILTNVGIQEEDPLSGRAKPFIGGLTEHALANSPIARMLTTTRQLTDERKRENPIFFPGDALAINLLTGMKTTDISPAAQDAVLRDALTPVLMDELGGRAYTNIYIPKRAIQDAEERGDYETANRMRAARVIQKMLQDRAKLRKKEREATEGR